MEISKKNILVLFIIILILFANQFFYYVNWNNKLGGWISYFLYGSILLFYILTLTKSINKGLNFENIVLGLVIVPFITIIMSSLEFGQSPIDSFKALFPNFTLLVYFLLHEYKIKEKIIIKMMMLYVIILFLIQVIQQLTYPTAFFGVYSMDQQNSLLIDSDVDMRNGLYRFRFPGSSFFTMLILFFYWVKIQLKFSFRYIFIILCSIISIYLTLTRQLWATVFLTLFISLLFYFKGRYKFRIIIFLVLISAYIYSRFDILFAEMISLTKNDVSEDNIRIFSYAFYIEKIVHNVFTFFFGYGLPSSQGPFFAQVKKWNEVNGFYTSDIGLIGQWFHYGLIYVLIFFYIIYKILFKYRKMVPIYIKLFLLATLFISPMISPLANPFSLLVWAFVLYITDLHFNKSQLRIRPWTR